MYPLIHFTETLSLPTYLLIISTTYILATLWLVHRTRQAGLSRQIALDLALAIMIGGFVGSRLFHVVLEQPQLYWQNPGQILQFWLGGFVFYGGAVGAVLSTGLIFMRKKITPWAWFDLFAPLFAFGYALGRVSCFFAGCCFGRDCPYPWAVHFPPGVEAPAHIPIHPTQLYAVVWELGALALLLFFERQRRRKKELLPVLQPAGSLLFVWGVFHSIGRIIMESFRGDYRGEFWGGLSISTWISLFILIACAGTLYYRSRRTTAG